jgi:hypothetical protein
MVMLSLFMKKVAAHLVDGSVFLNNNGSTSGFG